MSSRNSGFGAFLILLVAVIAIALVLTPASPPPGAVTEAELAAERLATGGAQTRDSIMARQRGEAVDLSYRRTEIGNPEGGAPLSDQLGTLGGASDAEIFRALRYNEAAVTTTSQGPAGKVLIQDGGMTWLKFRESTLAKYGGWLLLGMTGFLALFYLIRGRVPIAGEKTGRRMLRFGDLDRFIHWTTAGSFVLLALTGLVSMYGRPYLIPLMGKDAHAVLAHWSKLVHNNVSWAFIVGVFLIFLKWVRFNIPNWNDVRWLTVMGGLFDDSIHPPAGKFNAGQKIIFWSVVALSAAITASGLSLLMPFNAHPFSGLFAWLNGTGLGALIGEPNLATNLAPQQEMQLTQLVHATVGYLFMAMIIGHIYIGTIGMEGAFDAMGSGYVEEQWAKEHHSLWYEEVKAGETQAADGVAAPAE